MKRLRPAHPGKLLLDEFIKPMNLTAYRVAKDAGIPQSTLASVVSGHRSISAETGIRLGLYFGVDEFKSLAGKEALCDIGTNLMLGDYVLFFSTRPLGPFHKHLCASR